MTDTGFDRAIGYPYFIPGCSYIYHNGTYEGVQDRHDFPDVTGLTPVLAVGSNQSPAQLSRKFAGPDWAAIPVSRVLLRDFDTVYSAHITGYGSIAAMLFPAPGTSVSLFVNWLDEPHLQRMHETELGNENYEFGQLTDINLQAESGPDLTKVFFYNSRRGVYAPEGLPVSLAEVPAIDRRAGGMTQRQVQASICARLDPDVSLEDFVRQSIADPIVRQSRTEQIGQGSLPFQYHGYIRVTH